MPVIALIVSTLLFWLLYWFFQMGGLDHIRDSMQRKRDEARRKIALETEQLAPLAAVEDPRDAAIVLMLLIARNGDAPTREQYAAIEQMARSTFGFERELTERMAHARFVAGRAESFEQAIGLFSNLLKSRLTEAERRQLVAMVEKIAAHDGPSATQSDAIGALKLRFWPA